MDIQNRAALKQASRQALAGSPADPRRLALTYGGITAGITIACMLAVYLLETQIRKTTGLGSLGLRSTLQTMQTLLLYLPSTLGLFLGIGYRGAILRIGQGANFGDRPLMGGFRLFGPVLRLTLLQGLLFFGVAMVCSYAATVLFFMSPMSTQLAEVLTPLVNSSTADLSTLDEATMEAIYELMQPMTILAAVLCVVGILFVSYPLRMSTYVLVDTETPKAMAALAESFRMMRSRKKHLFMLDLSFWWYYLLIALSSLLSYGGDLLQLLGISIDPTVASLAFGALAALAQFGITATVLNSVEGTYVQFYLAARENQPVRTRPAPSQQPWRY